MNILFDGKVIILGDNDMTIESQGREKKLNDIKGGFEIIMRANYVFYYDEKTMELAVLKSRRPLNQKYNLQKKQ